MRTLGAILDLGNHLRRFAGNRDGVSAVEFAIILPFMLTLYIGGAEVGDGMAIQFKATLAARTVADLTSQCGDATAGGVYCDTANGQAIDNSSMSEILGAASQVVSPYSAANMTVTVSELKVLNGSSSGKVVWSAASSGSGRTINSTYALPTALQSLPNNPNGYYYVIFGEVTYPYTPSMGYVLTGTINIYQNSIFFPRVSNCVIYVNNGTSYPSSC
jgi:Flp pilus assembly protein TadG